MKQPEEVLLKPKQFPSFPKEGYLSPGVGLRRSHGPLRVNLIPWRGEQL